MAALRQIVVQAPAPVVAHMLGYSTEHTEVVAVDAGETWKTYALGGHSK
jgi:hypothetical protein